MPKVQAARAENQGRVQKGGGGTQVHALVYCNFVKEAT